MTVSEGIGIYGAALSSLLFFWQLYKHQQEKPRISVKCGIARVVITSFRPIDSEWGVTYEGEGIGSAENPPFVAYRVTNTGAKEVVVEDLGGIYKNGKRFTADNKAVNLPRRMPPGDFFQMAVQPSAVRSDLKSLGVWDSTGKMWKASRKETRDVRDQADYLREYFKTHKA